MMCKNILCKYNIVPSNHLPTRLKITYDQQTNITCDLAVGLWLKVRYVLV